MAFLLSFKKKILTLCNRIKLVFFRIFFKFLCDPKSMKMSSLRLQTRTLRHKEIIFPRSHVKLAPKLGLLLRDFDYSSSSIYTIS